MAHYEFHVSRQSREKYAFDDGLFALDGNVLLADFAAARRFAEKLSADRPHPVPASDINALGLIDEVLHILIRQYELQNPGVMARALDRLAATLGETALDASLLSFNEYFPPLAVWRGTMPARIYLAGSTRGIAHRQTTLEELLLLYITNLNPAASSYKELFDDSGLRRAGPYDALLELLQTFLEGEGPFTGGGETLIRALRAPALASPDSLTGQLEFLIRRWGGLLGEAFTQRLLRAVDFIKEEFIRSTGPGGFGGEAPLLEFRGVEAHEYERFSADKDWMPRLVLMARNSYVWLEQLSRKYGRWIKTLDQIPDEELDLLAARGFTGLWLIGLWERSRASQRIKHWMGDPDAVASAYSLHSYDIASDLGGWDALNNLRGRAWQRGIRLSADMVPNHMGIDSTWVVEHPEWFLSLPYSPYPNYSFNSGDLSDDTRMAIFLEDHYYTKSDAAVVFKRVDRHTGDVRYIYHGNDGTSMPWNDTAQLDYSNPEVREAVIQTILHVARNFPIIRFDAAMTLARKHIQRLWFPEPGAGGAIPSRSEQGMPRAEFDACVPNEFWREVVDRVAAEVPDTLLLAEAFWLMEGYFVRTLGMHRVYNSAFMHMLRDEDNAKYRQVMKNVLEFEPQVLQRFVNFMNNPDEKTAAEQFGTTDKYFGVATLLATLPGLPMFGHGQVEGFREKYGMEFRKPKWDEQVDEGLVRGHEARLFPLLHRRSLFAGSEHFLLYDFFAADSVNEDVFAYSNRLDLQRGLVVYHNKYAHTAGWIKTASAIMDKFSGQLVQRSLGEGLALPTGQSDYAIFRDYVTGREYIRSCRELWEKGLFVELGSYQCHVFLDWRFVSGEQWRKVCAALDGAPAASIEAKFNELFPPEVEAPVKKKPVRKTPAKPRRKKDAQETTPLPKKAALKKKTS